MAKSTRIFSVEYNFREVFDGKTDAQVLSETQTVVAENAGLAIDRVGLALAKERNEFKDDETGKRVVATRTGYDPINVKLLAEA